MIYNNIFAFNFKIIILYYPIWCLKGYNFRHFYFDYFCKFVFGFVYFCSDYLFWSWTCQGLYTYRLKRLGTLSSPGRINVLFKVKTKIHFLLKNVLSENSYSKFSTIKSIQWLKTIKIKCLYNFYKWQRNCKTILKLLLRELINYLKNVNYSVCTGR